MSRQSLLIPVIAAALLGGCTCTARLPDAMDGDGGPGGGKADTGFDFGSNPNPDPTDPPDAGGAPTLGIGPGAWTDPNNGTVSSKVDGLKPDKDGNLVLDSSQVKLNFAWLANPEGFGTVSKIDTETGREVGRYYTAIPVDGKGARTGLTYNQAHSPSRTAVDLYGDVWVANRAFGLQASVTKISNARQGCTDRNSDGVIQTSEDKNQNGVIEANEMITPSDPNDPNTYDECVLFSTPIGTAAEPGVARALAIDQGTVEGGGAGNIWVGLWCGLSGTGTYDAACLSDYYSRGGVFVKLSGLTGERIPVDAAGNMYVAAPIKAYGAAVDNKNRLWFGTYNKTVAAGIDVATGAVLGPYKPSFECGSYGMTVQVTSDGHARIWHAAIACPNTAVRYDVDTNTWTKMDFTNQLGGEKFGYGRGIAVDANKTAWMSSYYDPTTGSAACGTYVARLVGVDTETGALKAFSDGKHVADFTAEQAAIGKPVPCNGIGVGLDNTNRVWVAGGNGIAISADRTTGAQLPSPRVGSALYTYSDFTGFALRTFTSPGGTFKAVYKGCAPSAKTTWQTLTFKADVPAGTKVQLFVKSAPDKDKFDEPGVKRFGPFEGSPVDLVAAGVPANTYLQVEVVMKSTDKVSTPVLKGLDVTWSCSGGLR